MNHLIPAENSRELEMLEKMFADERLGTILTRDTTVTAEFLIDPTDVFYTLCRNCNKTIETSRLNPAAPVHSENKSVNCADEYGATADYPFGDESYDLSR